MSEQKTEQKIQLRLNPEINGWRTEKKPDKELMEDIRTKGQVEAITARKLPDGTLEIISGNRRYAALLELGTKPEDMKITVLENVSDTDAVLMALSGNRYRKDFTAIEEARAFNTLKTMKWSVKKISEHVERSESYVRDRLDMLDLPKEVQKMVADGKVEASYSAAINKLKEFPEAQKELAKKIATAKSYGGIHSVKEAEEEVTKVIAEKERREKLALDYGPCPNCGSANIDKAGWGDTKKLGCQKCKYEWNAETKDPWALYELKRDAKILGLNLDIEAPGKAKLTPLEVTELIAKQDEDKEDKENPSFRSNRTVTELLMPFISEDNVLTMSVDNEDITLKLISGTGQCFKAITKPYRSGEKSRITASTWHDNDAIAKVRKYNEDLKSAEK